MPICEAGMGWSQSPSLVGRLPASTGAKDHHIALLARPDVENAFRRLHVSSPIFPRRLNRRASREEAFSGHDQGEPAGSHGGCVIVVLPRSEAWLLAVLLQGKAAHHPDVLLRIRGQNRAASGA